MEQKRSLRIISRTIGSEGVINLQLPTEPCVKVSQRQILKWSLLALLFLHLIFNWTNQAHSFTNSSTIKIGVIGPLTSPSKTFGIGHLQGITLAVEEYNNDNEPKKKISIIIADDESKQERGIIEVNRMIENGVIAIMGPCNSKVARALIDKVLVGSKKKIPIISSTTTATELTDNLKTDFFFRCNVSDLKRIEQLVDGIINKFHTSKIAIIYEGYGDTYGEGLYKDFYSVLKDKYHFRNYKKTKHQQNIDFEKAREIVSSLKKEGYGTEKDAYVLLNLESDARTFSRAIKDVKIESKIYTIEASHRLFEEDASRELIYVHGSRHISAFAPRSSRIHDFYRNFREKFKHEPDYAAALSYDAARILLSAINKMITEDRENENLRGDISALRERLKEALKDPSISNNIKFVIVGNHIFDKNNEFKDLDFNGYQLAYKSGKVEIIPWGEPLPEIEIEKDRLIEPFYPQPSLAAWILLYVAAAIGSFIRKWSILTSKALFLRNLKSTIIMSLLINPFIAFIVYLCFYLYLVVFENYTKFYEDPSILIYGSIAVGSLAGLLGIKTIYYLLEKLGITIKLSATKTKQSKVIEE